jgi:hypothetical protein
VPAGYLADNGAVFADRGNGFSYGWARKNTRGARDRNKALSPDQRYDTFVPLRKWAWEMAVPDGSYRVHVVSGDAATRRGRFKAVVEGTPVVDGAQTVTDRWVEGWADVAVADGRLTVTTAPGARGNRINFVDVIPLDLAPGIGSAARRGPGEGAAPTPPLSWSPATAAARDTARPSATRDLFGSSPVLPI